MSSSLWRIEWEGIDLKNERNVPTLLTIGNGEIGIRGTVPELADENGGVFLAGFFDGLPRPEVDPERFNPFLRSWSHMELVPGYHLESALANAPDPLDGQFLLDGQPLRLDTVRGREVRRSLDMRTGECCFVLPLVTQCGRRALLTRRRSASLRHPQQLYERCELTVDAAGTAVYQDSISTRRQNSNISGIYLDMRGYVKPAKYTLYDVLDEEADEHAHFLRVRGRVKGLKAAFLATSDRAPRVANAGDTLVWERRVTFACELLHDTRPDALKAEMAQTTSYEQALADNREAWQELWHDCDLCIEGDDHAQLGIRHSLYQLLIAAPRTTDRVSVAAKGLTGEGYRGMVFWDTDIHMLPFYLYTRPQIAKNIAGFRLRTLAGAVEKAHDLGFVGASYPWETDTTGREECESFLKLITNQLHITADVVYAVRSVEEATGELPPLQTAELYIQTARFWLSKGHITDGKLGIPLASGPDELHLDSNNNAYVVCLAARNILLAKEALRSLAKTDPEALSALKARIGMTEDEADCILAYEGGVQCRRTPDGVWEQCEGFFALEDRIVYEEDDDLVPADTQTVKQADVMMLLYLLPHLATPEELLSNWRYYEPRTTHTSSLSFGVHGIIAAKLGLEDKADYYLGRSLGIDLDSERASCADGAHLAANGMSWSAIVNGLAGVSMDGDEITVQPRLPKAWSRLAFRLCHRGNTLCFTIEQDAVHVAFERGQGRLMVRTPDACAELTEGMQL